MRGLQLALLLVILKVSVQHVSAFLSSSLRDFGCRCQLRSKLDRVDEIDLTSTRIVESITAIDHIKNQEFATNAFSRRILIRGVFWTITSGIFLENNLEISHALVESCTETDNNIKIQTKSKSGRLVDQAIPDEKEIYAEAQNEPGAPIKKRILWIGSGDTVRGVSSNLFQAGNEVVALDLARPDKKDLRTSTSFANEHGYKLRFVQGDATKLKFSEGTFDVVVSSMFLCQDFDPEVVVSEIWRVLKPGGRFGFYEHVEDIDKVIVDKVFGERSIVQIQAYPEEINIIAGVMKKL